MSIRELYRVIPLPKFQASEWLLKKHYAKRRPSVEYAFGLYDAGMALIGVCTYGTPPRPLIDQQNGIETRQRN